MEEKDISETGESPTPTVPIVEDEEYISQLLEDSGFTLAPGEKDLLPNNETNELVCDLIPSNTSETAPNDQEEANSVPVLITQVPDQEGEDQPQETDKKKAFDVIVTEDKIEDEDKEEESVIETEDQIEDEDFVQYSRSSLEDDDEEEDDMDPYEARAREIQMLIENDSLWDTDLEDEEDPEVQEALHDTTGRCEYVRLCEKLGVVPVKFFSHHIQDVNLTMRYHGLGPGGTKAIARVMQGNITVETLDLSGNWMECVGGEAIAKMIEENGYIQKLVLADNKLRWDGMTAISKAIPINTNIVHLDLAGNDLGDMACESLAYMIENSKSMVDLILRHNGIGSEGAEILGPAFYSNDVLERLDLSWNSIRGEGAVTLAKSLKDNIRIKWCNLSWNGFAKEGGKALTDMIRENGSIQELDISGNRLDSEVAVLLGKALVLNEVLTHLYMGNNPINTTGVLQFIAPLEKCDNSPCVFLSLFDIPVEFEFIKTIENMQTKLPEFVCEYGPELRVGNTEGDIKKEAVNLKNPITLLREHYIVNDFRLIGVLQRLDENSTKAVTPAQFAEALNELGIPYKKSHIDDVKKKLDKNGDGTIYYGDFVPPEGPRRESGLAGL